MTTKIFLSTYRQIFQLLLGLSIFTLCFVYIAEYAFAMKPCPLCIYQRIPYFLLLPLAAIGHFVNRDQYSKYICYACSILFISGFLVALYHTGVERGVITESCSAGTDVSMSMESLKNYIYNNTISCKDVQLRIAGFSAAEINTVLSFLMFVYILLSVYWIESKKIKMHASLKNMGIKVKKDK